MRNFERNADKIFRFFMVLLSLIVQLFFFDADLIKIKASVIFSRIEYSYSLNFVAYKENHIK